jgi:hypothetical protein
MMCVQRSLVLLILAANFGCSFRASAGEVAELVLKGDKCVRAEGLGQLERVTLAMWLQIHHLPGDFNSILHSDGWEQGDWHLLLRRDGRLQHSVKGNRPTDARASIRLPADKSKWRHLAVVYDAPGKACRIYLDGDEVSRIELATAVPVNLDKFCMGAWNCSERGLPAAFRDIVIYDQLLNAADVEKLFAGNVPSLKPLVHWRGDRRSEELTDSSGRGHHAELTDLKQSGVPPDQATPDPDRPVYSHPVDRELNPWADRAI